MSFNQKNLKIMGNLIANLNKEPIENIINKYEMLLYSTFSKGSRCNSNINILQQFIIFPPNY